MPSAFLWSMLVPYALRASAPVNLGVSPQEDATRGAKTISPSITGVNLKQIHIATLTIAFLSQTEIAIASNFSDSDFNLSNYTIQSFSSGQTVGISQSSSMGNPGNALRIDIFSNAGSTRSLSYFLNQHFLHSPQNQGDILSISLSSDVYVQNSLSSGSVATYGQMFLLAQDGKYYTHFKSVTPSTGIYHSATTGALTASDFSLITNLETGTTNSTIHPNFNGSTITFGIVQAAFERTSKNHSIVELTDNFTVTISVVPEPTAGALAASSLGFLLLRKKFFKRLSPTTRMA